MRLSRTLLGALLVLAAMAIGPAPAQAGTAEAPEVTDGTGDPVAAGQGACPAGCAAAPQFIDLTMGWVGTETATDIQLWMDVAGNANANAYGSAQFDFHFNVAGTDHVAGFNVRWASVQSGLPGSGAVTPTGVASAAAYAEAAMVVTVPKSALGEPAAGSIITGLFVTSTLFAAEEDVVTFRDRAPNADFGLDYVVLGAGDAADPFDTDLDGLNDTWEMEQFGNITLHNGTSDPDEDGLNNTAEQTFGTNATNPDTDGDGILDGDEVVNGTDPLVADLVDVIDGATGNETIEEDTGNNTVSGDLDGDEGLLDTFTSDLAYAGSSAGGLLGVVALSLLGIAVRWGL